MREVVISVQFRNLFLLIGSPALARSGCIARSFNCFCRCARQNRVNAAVRAESFAILVVSLNIFRKLSRSALTAKLRLIFAALTLSATNVSCSHSPNSARPIAGRITAGRMNLSRKNRFPFTKSAARIIFSPLLSDIPAVSRKSATVCQARIGTPSRIILPET